MRTETGILFILVPALLLLFSSPAPGDTLTLDDGTTYEGKVLSDSGGKIRFKTSSGMTLTIEKSRVKSIVKGRTKLDEYKERLAALEKDDLAGHFELAEWCGEKRLHSQRRKVLARIRRKCPDHPRLHRELGEVWQDGKWVREPKDLPPLTVVAGDRTRMEEEAATLALPRDWKVAAGGSTVTATGPDRYKVPPVLKVEFLSDGDVEADPFPGKEGWEKPAEASAAGLLGHRSRRVVTEEGIDRIEEVALLAGKERALRVSLVCLRGEERTYAQAMDIALRSLAFDAPKADYVNKHYGYACDLPGPSDKWKHTEDDEHDLAIMHERVQVTDYARLLVIGADGDEEIKAVRQLYEGLKMEVMRYGGKEEQIDFCGEKASFVDGTYLDRGIPCRLRLLLVEHGKRLYLITFDQHEHGQEKTNSGWDAVVDSFRFL